MQFRSLPLQITRTSSAPKSSAPKRVPQRFFRAILLSVLITLLSQLGFSHSAYAAWLRPVSGSGNFPITVDVINSWRDESVLDVSVIASISNCDINLIKDAGRYRGRLSMEVIITGLDGQEVRQKRNVRCLVESEAEANQATLFQVFGIVLENVPFRSGRVVCRIIDSNKISVGIPEAANRRYSTSEAVADWNAEDSARPESAISIGDPLFLVQAPLRSWDPNWKEDLSKGTGYIQDYLHPARRYGLEQEKLQLYVPVWPETGGASEQDLTKGILVQVVSSDYEYAVTDTINLDDRGRAALRSGKPSALVYELDVNLLPEGSYTLSLAPLAGRGRALVSGFDVTWTMQGIGTHRNMIAGEGRTVFGGDKRKAFIKASLPEQERMLNEFWDSIDPDPESPVNEAYLEFKYRVAYVARFLGGFDEEGSRDPRGEVFVLLGPPESVERNAIPMNERDQEDAMVKVFKPSAPDREGTWAKGSGGIPMPYSQMANDEVKSRQTSASMLFGFELWKYPRGGKPLFANYYSASGSRKRFLFVDTTGAGDYVLESSNVISTGD